MNLRSKKESRIRGSGTLEVCLIIPVILITLIFGISLIRTVVAVNCLEKALCRTAELLSGYGILYHEYGIKELENRLLSEIGNFINEKTGDDGGISVLFRFSGLRECAAAGDDILYSKMAEVICEHYISKDPLVSCGFISPDGLSFTGSNFFNGNDDIELYASCKLFGWLKIGTSLRSRAWIRGDNPLLSIGESGVTVWELNNFARGKILRSIFGGNMPYDFPVLSSFDPRTGAAAVIKSIDITAPTYQDPKIFSKELREIADKFTGFSGTEGYSLKPDHPVIRDGDIRTKRLLLVFPSNEMSEAQRKVLNDFIVYASADGMKLEFVTYQKSKRYIRTED